MLALAALSKQVITAHAGESASILEASDEALVGAIAGGDGRGRKGQQRYESDRQPSHRSSEFSTIGNTGGAARFRQDRREPSHRRPA